ncbi:hypothetical protein ACFW15_19610, partial [Streptomyces sp. NPDC058953]
SPPPPPPPAAAPAPLPPPSSVPGSGPPPPGADEGARGRLGIAEAALLSSLVAGTPAPEEFDQRRLRVQSRALAVKRSRVVAKIAPELPEILGREYRSAFLTYARNRPMRSGYRRDAMSFAEHLLVAGRPEDAEARERLTRWWQERAGVRPRRRTDRIFRAARAARAVLVRR